MSNTQHREGWFGFTARAVLLAIVWAALQGSFAPYNLVMGVVLGGIIVWFTRPLYTLSDTGDRAYTLLEARPLRRIWRFFVLMAVFLWELVKSALQVAYLVLQPTLKMQPGVIAYPLNVQSGREITVLANLISLTPGTLSLEVTDDRRVLYIHAIFVEDEEAADVRDSIKQSLEKHVARALGPYEEKEGEGERERGKVDAE